MNACKNGLVGALPPVQPMNINLLMDPLRVMYDSLKTQIDEHQRLSLRLWCIVKRLHLLQLNFTLLSVVQRYKCSEIAQALKESHTCLLVSFVISGSSYINSLFQIVRTLDWIRRVRMYVLSMWIAKTIRHKFWPHHHDQRKIIPRAKVLRPDTEISLRTRTLPRA